MAVKSKLYDPAKVKDMPKVILRAYPGRAGQDFVAAFHALSVALMMKPPEMINWGERAFVFKEQQPNGNLVYVEGMIYPLMETLTCDHVEDFKDDV